MLNKKILFILMITLLVNIIFAARGFAQEGLALNIDANKYYYKPSEEVIVYLKFTGVTDQKTNSLGISIGYDNDVLELLTNNPEYDIVDGYIPFNSKVEVGQYPDKYIRLDYFSPVTYKNIIENEVVAAVHFKIKHGVENCRAQIAVLDAVMLNDENMYHINMDKNAIEIQVASKPQISVRWLHITDENNEEIYDLTDVNQINIEAGITNNLSQEVSVTLIAVLYDENNSVISISMVPKTIEPLKDLEDFYILLKVPEQSKAYKLKVMFWNGFRQIYPLKSFYKI